MNKIITTSKIDDYSILCEYDELCDKDPVEVVPQADWDLNSALVENTLGNVGAPIKGEFNNLPVDKILGTVRDQFAALEMNKVVRGFTDKRGEVNKSVDKIVDNEHDSD